MKKNILFLGVIVIASITSSCQKCSTCTYNDAEKGVITSEVCNTGNAYKTAIEVHEDNGWSCSAK
jgi:hypothetical protein